MVLKDNDEITRVWDAFANAGFRYASNDGSIHKLGELDALRRERLPHRRQLLQDFLDEELDLESFRSEMASEAGQNKLWGYSGTSGGMFLNMLISSADSEVDPDLSQLLRETLDAPENKEVAANKIRRLENRVETIRDQSENIQSAPQAGNIPYFLSYFWQLQDPDTYPIYYKSIRDALSDLDIWNPNSDLASDYLEFWKLNEEIREVLESYTGDEIHLWTIERMFLFWLSRDQLESPSELSEAQQDILERWKQAASKHERAKHFIFDDSYSPEEARQRAEDFVQSPNRDTFARLWDPMHSAQRSGSANVIYQKWRSEKERSDEKLAELIDEIKTADEYDPAWEGELGAKRTLWELFGLLHIEEYPIINGSTERGLEFFGYDCPYRYLGAAEQFEAFKSEYERIVGHATADTAHEVSINFEIDQLLNVIDKVKEGDPSEASIGSVSELYRLVLDEKHDDNPPDPIIDPEQRRPPKAWQVAPDGSLDLWESWVENGVMSIGWEDAGDIGGLSKEELADRLATDTNSNNVTTLYYFANSILPGDVIVARHGRTEIDGIGVVTSEYYYDPERAADSFPNSQSHHHKLIDVEWIIDFVADHDGPLESPDSIPMFAMETVRGYSHYEELKHELVDSLPDLSETFSLIEERQSELSTAYWMRADEADEYSGIEEATTDILQRLESRTGGENWLGDLILGSVIRAWTDILRQNDLVGGDIDSEDRQTLDRILELYQENESRLERQADEIGAGWVGSLTNGQTLFVALFRDLQTQSDVSRPNLNHVKMGVLLNEGHKGQDQEPLTGIPDKPDDAHAIERQLTRAGQLVFHGPPGTGKTYMALRFARWWLNQQITTPTESQLEAITFHPSFTYEDFIEGLTAKERDGAVEYSVESGVFKRFSDRARKAYDEDGDDADPYILVIDEINRGNLAQIFGETITLLEPDKRLGAENETATTLPHSKDRFTVPPNLYVIGTMNTADRSIALVDAALRRRFRFIEFPPKMRVLYQEYNFEGATAVESAAESSSDPVRQLLALSIEGLEALNEAILDAPNLGKGKQIGHSYLFGIDEGDTEEERLQSIVDAWQYEILPLLEEYYYGQFDRIREDLFDGGAGRLFDWDTEQITAFDPDDLAKTLITLTETTTEWAGTEPSSIGAAVTYQTLLDNELLRKGDSLVFNPERVPDDATRSFDSSNSFWQCEVTGEPDKQNQVRWKRNDELYPLAELSQKILEEVSDFGGQTDSLRCWRHPRYGDRDLSELGAADEAEELGVPEATSGEAGE